MVTAAHHFSIACRQPGIPPWVDGAVEAVVASRFAAQRGCADQDAGGVVGGLRVTQLVPHADQQLACVGTEGEGFDFGGFRQPLLVEARRVDGFLDGHAVVDDIDDRACHHGDDAATAGCADDHDRLAVARDDGRAHRA